MNDIDLRTPTNEPSRIVAAPTTITAFVGVAEQGDFNTPTPILSLTEFTARFGSDPRADLTYAVRLFFDNGGQTAIIVRVPSDGDAVSRYSPPHHRGGIYALEATPTINILNLPGIADSTVLGYAIAYAEQRGMFLVIDPPLRRKKPLDSLLEWVNSLERSPNAALFYPHVRVRTAHQKLARITAPGGAIAGVMARSDTARGVWKAPAGTDATLNGAVSLTVDVSDTDSGILTRNGINPLRTIPQRGIVNWGARTLRGVDTRNDEWKYIPVRRVALFIAASLDEGLNWVVFEPNAEPLWLKVRAAVEDFMFTLWRQGAFAGTTPHEAYTVQCDRSTMTQADLEEGRLVAVVGYASLRPAEFVMLRWVIAIPHA